MAKRSHGFWKADQLVMIPNAEDPFTLFSTGGMNYIHSNESSYNINGGKSLMANRSHDQLVIPKEEDPFSVFSTGIDYFPSDVFSTVNGGYTMFENWDLDLLPPLVNDQSNIILEPNPITILPPTNSYFSDFSSSFDLDPINLFFGLDLDHILKGGKITCHDIQDQTLAISDGDSCNVEDDNLVLETRRQPLPRAAKRSRSEDGDGDGVDGHKKEKARKSIAKYFYMPINQAAKEMNIGLTLLKKMCREVGICRWPHRKLMSLQTLINNIKVQKMRGEISQGKRKEAIEMLEMEMKLLEEFPDLELGEDTKRLRQACFKANYKKRKLIAGTAADSWSSSSLSTSSGSPQDDDYAIEILKEYSI